ncbi:MAG: gamma-glutamyltransferase [Ginsengibacter sp.]
MMTKILFAAILLLFFSIVSNGQHELLAVNQKINGFKYGITKTIICKNGVVVSAHTLASKAGVMMLKAGGNAIDAAIATQLALAVVYPGAGNIGGGGFLIAHLAGGKNISIDYRETAPHASSRDMYLDANGVPQTKMSLDGHLSVGVPGTIAGLYASLKYARLAFRKLIQPAIDLAENGFVISEGQAKSFNDNREQFVALNTTSPVFVTGGSWKAGDTLIQKDLAKTLRRIRDGGAREFYEGTTAKLIVEEMNRGKGIITLEDLKNYKAKKREPISFAYKGFTVLTMGLPSSGGIILEQMMKMTEGRSIAKMNFETAESVHLMTEIERRAYADRAKFLGDPDFVKVPEKILVSKKYLDERMKDFDPAKAGNSTSISAGNLKESEQTTHLDVYDREGNAVSVTTTLNNSYGSKTVVSGAGFLLNDEMDDFSAKPGVPNLYGAIGAEANAIVPGKRMLSSMTPTIVLKNNKPFLVIGTPGGTTITTSVYQTLLDILEFNLNATDAVNRPKFHHQWLPDRIDVEKEFPQDVRNQLTQMGYTITERAPIGRTELILIHATGKLEAVADKRGDDSAEGY